MLPVSGALQLNTSGARCERPMISHKGAYSRLVRPPWIMRRQKQVPQPRGSRERLQFLDDRMHGPGAEALGFLVIAALVRIDVLGHEGADAHRKFGAAGALADVHGGLLYRDVGD